MAQAEIFVALLVAVVLFALAAHRLHRVPHAVALVVGGVVVGLLSLTALRVAIAAVGGSVGFGSVIGRFALIAARAERAGYVMGRTDQASSPTTRMGAESFWGVVRFLVESILFLLVDPRERSQLYRRLQRQAMSAQRAELARLRSEGEVHGELLRSLQRDLDIEEMRLG